LALGFQDKRLIGLI